MTDIKNSTKNGLDEIAKIPVRQYIDNNGNQITLGIIANEVALIEPELVIKFGDSGYIPNESGLFSYIIDSIQRLNSKSNDLQAQIATLQTQITELKNKTV